jgi:hypothetical protein
MFKGPDGTLTVWLDGECEGKGLISKLKWGGCAAADRFLFPSACCCEGLKLRIGMIRDACSSLQIRVRRFEHLAWDEELCSIRSAAMAISVVLSSCRNADVATVCAWRASCSE